MIKNRKSIFIHAVIITAVSGLLYLTTLPNYLLFHSLAEIFSIVIACGVFMIAWNSRNITDNRFLTYLGIAYLFIGILDLFHTLAYKGMKIFLDYDYYANQLWIAARYIESISLLLFLWRTEKKEGSGNFSVVFLIYLVLTAAVLVSIFILKIFPVCFIDGTGLTLFKKISEYIISLILLITVFALFRRRKEFSPYIYKMLAASVLLTIGSELSFTFYISNYGIVNYIGHILKIWSFFFIYKAIIETGLKRPMDLIFQRLKQSNEDKDKFFSIIAHDLKNPFSGILSASELLQHEADIISAEERNEFIEMITESARQSMNLLDNLLLWARMQTDRIEFQPSNFSIKRLIDENIHLFHNNTANKLISISNNVHDSVLVRGDRNMIDLIIRNLLSNAIKFSFEGGDIVFSYTMNKNHVSINVQDFGKGISDKDLKMLFQVGAAKSRKGTHNETGTGLGLILCKEFIEKNNGEIKVSSEPEKGSIFTFSLPVGET